MPRLHKLPTISLSPKIESLIDSEKILSNKDNYPELDWKPDTHEQTALTYIREMFLDVELSHATASDPKLLQEEGVIPSGHLTDNQIGRAHV